MGKDYGKRLKVGETPMITQTENYMEKEVLSTEENIATPAVAQPMAPIGNYAQRLTGRQQTKGIVIDMPVDIYRRLRDVKDYLPGETLKSLALRAVVEFVERNKVK
jgi:hypothetical protein